MLSSEPQVTFPKDKFVDDRLNNLHPVRVFDPIADLADAKGLITVSALKKEIEKVNSPQYQDTIFKEAFERLTTSKSINLNPGHLAKALRSTLLSAFPVSTLPEHKVMTNTDEVISALNLSASSGYPRFVKKRLLVSDIRKVVSQLTSAKIDFPSWKRATLFSIFTRIQAKAKGELSMRLFFAPS